MYVAFPNFQTFTNVATCPSASGMEGCYIADASENQTDYQNLFQDTFSFLPYLQGHLYFIYPCRSGIQLKPTKFKSEEELFQHLKAYLGTQQISGGSFRVPVVKDIPSVPVAPTVFMKLSEGKVVPAKVLCSDSATSVVEFNTDEEIVSNTVRKPKTQKKIKSKKIQKQNKTSKSQKNKKTIKLI